MQYIYGIHAVDSLLRQNPKSVQRLWVQQGRDDRRIGSLLELAQNQGVPIAREQRQDLDNMVNGRHQGVIAETLNDPVHGEVLQANVWQESDWSFLCVGPMFNSVDDPLNSVSPSANNTGLQRTGPSMPSGSLRRSRKLRPRS